MFTHRRNVTIEWGDCDPAGIVFYPRYLAMFDASTAALFVAALALSKREILHRFGIIGFPMVDVRAKFQLPCSYCDTVTIKTRVINIGRSSFEIEHQLTRGSRLAVECIEKRVWAEKNPNKPSQLRGIPVPREVREILLQQIRNSGDDNGVI